MIHGLPLYCQSFPPVFSQHTRYKKTAFRITLVTKCKSALPVQNDRKRADLHLCNKIISTTESNVLGNGIICTLYENV